MNCVYVSINSLHINGRVTYGYQISPLRENLCITNTKKFAEYCTLVNVEVNNGVLGCKNSNE